MHAIDAARGIAMVLVCLSHVRAHFEPESPALYFLLTTLTRIATPTFILLSGFVAAYVLDRGGARARLTLVDRGLFVLLIGHFALNLEDLQSTTFEHWVFGRVTITDAIGICLVCATVLHRLSAPLLAIIGGSLAIVSWPIAITQSFESPAARYLGAAFFNLRSEPDALVDAAIVPYLGVFAVGMALSKASAGSLRVAEFGRVARRLAIKGVIAVILVLAALGCWLAFDRLGLTPSDAHWKEIIKATLDPRSKLPPGPAYLLLYGGFALLLTAACFIAKPKVLMRPVVEWASTLGRASLMCFVLQDWILKLFPELFDFAHTTSVWFWSGYACLAIIVIHWLARRWDAIHANRFMTLGLRGIKMPG